MNSEVIGETGELKKVDRFGFFENDIVRSIASFECIPVEPSYDVKLENQRLKKWLEMLKNWKVYCTEKPNIIQRRIRKGIPDALRGRVWSLLLSADVCSDIYSQYYEDLLTNHIADENNDFTRKGGVIDRDINRTYPLHETFAENKGKGQETLRRVLLAFADHDKEIKYTQGMNYLVGLLLIYMTEEEAFWALCQLMDNSPFLMNQWFNQDLVMVHTSYYQMDKLLDKYLPEIGSYLKEINISPMMYTTEWFMCVYSRSFPYDVVVRIWDIFLAEGWTIVYQVALALLKLYEKDILGKEFEEVHSLISNINHSENLPSADVIIKTALSFPVTNEELELLRKEFARTRMTKITTVNDFIEEYKDFSVGEMKPALDVLFHSYDYEKEQLQIMDTMSSDEYKNLVTAYKTNRTMALRLVQSMDNGSKEEVVLFGCGHAIHRSCLDTMRCPVEGCWDGIDTAESSAGRRHSTSVSISLSKSEEETETVEPSIVVICIWSDL
ncbi:hypothetical protein WA171_004909 [Blastocystis sp. BT1]